MNKAGKFGDDQEAKVSAPSRRGFLGGAVAAAASLTLIAQAGPVRADTAPVDRRRVVVIGSGFGGGVAASRLAAAGVDVLVLERGIWWKTGPNAETFSHTLNPDKRSTWLDNTTASGVPALFDKYTGIIERVKGNGMDIMCGAAVGGGSLNYHGMTLQPTEANFVRDIPGIDYGPMNDIFYPRVAKVLQPTVLPDDLWNNDAYQSSRVVAGMIKDAGFQPFHIPLPIDWEFARMELRGQAKPAYTNSDITYGVNNGGKRSVDVTWIKSAVDSGHATVAPLHIVRDIARTAAGKWSIKADRIDTGGNVLEHKEIVADAVFLAGGSAGTTRLLVKAKAKKLISNLPDGVGKNWGSNGDRIYLVHETFGKDWGQQGGPANIGVKFWDDKEGPITIVHGTAPLPTIAGMASIIGYGSLKPKGVFTYDSGKDDAVLQWSNDYDAALVKRIREKVDLIFNNKLGAAVIDTNDTGSLTWHALGGATLGSVCDNFGRVLQQHGLYVVDGALIPGSTGACNPSFTIAALAERCMDDILKKDLGSVF
ncbi:GMC oxidoreductase [Nocardia sp.]|uniref:GMC oxidoreductase n=1 Tax=Nocardia sp. TaxID=1821 RepID=UPI002620B4B9|nr:GMC oxidoreductase [Nocardia sp.]